MRIALTKDCLGGERIVDIILPRGVRTEDLDRIRGAARKLVLEHLPRPLFRIEVPGRYLVSGAVGDARVRFTVRLALRDEATDAAQTEARHMIGSNG